ncbi:DUF4136 domain-containing protein [Pontibacter vulgaris]|uniref:DUF4136 domain-containing protein n=1 Tax=Pontibacter vulgaris TaxID=2905679 RepID=UPI001FA73C13|nr:DUF4136 domain-containing protein [Pontibacter vulgaris]
MMRYNLLCFFWILMTFLSSCSPFTVLDADSVEGFRLANYKTFDFVDVEISGRALGEAQSPQVELLKSEIAKQLAARGLTYDSGNADLAINIGIVVADKVQTRQTDYRTDAPRYVGQRRYTWKSQEVEVGRYKEGTLSLHLVEREKNELVWQGAIEAVVPKDADKQKGDIVEGVKKLISTIP